VRYFEDFKPGDVIELVARTITKERILAFAREFDPQPFHTDEEAAKRSIYGGLLASGWHTGSLLMRILYDGLLHDAASLGSPGIAELRWLEPVRPGDTLAGRMTILEAIPSRSKPDRGIIRSLIEMRNQQARSSCRSAVSRSSAAGRLSHWALPLLPSASPVAWSHSAPAGHRCMPTRSTSRQRARSGGKSTIAASPRRPSSDPARTLPHPSLSRRVRGVRRRSAARQGPPRTHSRQPH